MECLKKRNIDVQSTSKERSRSVWTQHLDEKFVIENDFDIHTCNCRTIGGKSIIIKSTKYKVNARPPRKVICKGTIIFSTVKFSDD